jgi:hypothetical protein
MPGLVRGVARTAVIAGTATAVSGRVQRRQAGRYAEPDPQASAPEPDPQPAAPPPPAPPAPLSSEDKITQLRELGQLRTEGVLSDAEFEAEKAKLLNA